MEAFLDKMNFKDGCVEYSMRRFLTTFRLAGVDSQVVSRIIESFSFKFFEQVIKSLLY
jgi:Sec7-like guanine-nucleotide exchange factor